MQRLVYDNVKNEAFHASDMYRLIDDTEKFIDKMVSYDNKEPKIVNNIGLSDEVEQSNISSLKKLLPHFYLSNDSFNRIINKINSKHDYLSSMLGLGKHGRLFIEIDYSEESIELYDFMIYRIENNLSGMEPDKRKIIVKELLENDVISFSNFLRNSCIVKKQTGKLFKYLLKKEILKQDEVDYINKSKTSIGKHYVCISRNPIDFLFCSTNQTFTSCENLESDYNGAFYMGLPGTFLDENRLLIFLVSEKNMTSDYIIKGEKFTHFKYIQRSWLIAGQMQDIENDICLALVRNYPCTKIKFSNVWNKIFNVKIRGYAKCNNNNFISLFPVNTPSFEDGSSCFIYIDNLGIGTYSDDNDYYCSDGSTGAVFTYCFNYTSGFEDLDYFNELTDKEICFCCERYVDREEAFYDEDGNCYCTNCYYDNFSTCEHCGNSVHNNETYYTQDEVILCRHCYENNTRSCDECGNTYYSENKMFETIDEYWICEDCLDQTSLCEKCGVRIYKEERYTQDDVCVCKDCFDEDCYVCEQCGKTYFNEIEKFEGKYYCSECYDEIMESLEEVA